MLNLGLISKGSWLLCILYVTALMPTAKASIYTAIAEDGTVKWATQALDNSYSKTSIAEHSVAVNPYKAVLVTSKIDVKTPSASRLALYLLILQTAKKYDVSPELVDALIQVESGFNTHAISPKGARGLMQLMPATARNYGMKDPQELHTPARNLDIGVRHLKDLLNAHAGQLALTLASYNAGQGAIAKQGQRIPSYRETMIYVPAVLAYMAQSGISQVSKEQ